MNRNRDLKQRRAAEGNRPRRRILADHHQRRRRHDHRLCSLICLLEPGPACCSRLLLLLLLPLLPFMDARQGRPMMNLKNVCCCSGVARTVEAQAATPLGRVAGWPRLVSSRSAWLLCALSLSFSSAARSDFYLAEASSMISAFGVPSFAAEFRARTEPRRNNAAWTRSCGPLGVAPIRMSSSSCSSKEKRRAS